MSIFISQTTSLAAIDKVYLGIPVNLDISSYPPNYSNINLFDAESGLLIFSYNSNSKKNLAMLLYKDFNNIDYNRRYVFATSAAIDPFSVTQAIADQYIPPVPGKDAIPEVRFPDINYPAVYDPIFGFKISDAYTVRGDIISEGVDAVLGKDGYTIPGSPEVINPPQSIGAGSSISTMINFIPYYTSLNTVSSINLNSPINVTVGWSNPNISNYGNDTVVVNIVDTNYTLVKNVGSFTNNSSVSNTQLSNLRSGTYYFQYDFANKMIDYSNGNSSISYTNSFSFTTKHIQSVSATGGANSTNVVLNIDVGYGYADYTYLITITDTNNVSSVRRDNFPYTFSSPLSTTMTYTVVVSNSDDGNDTNTASTTFISYKNITTITIANKIIQSSQNYLTWSGGSSMELFEYGNIQLFPIPKLNFFMNGNPLNATSLTKGTPYLIEPVQEKENSKNYGNFYFDSIESNQTPTILGPNGPFLSTSTSSILTWNAYYKYGTIAPDGNRIYDVTIGEYTGKSVNNTLSITNTNVQYGISYNIDVVDIRIATGYIFYQQPSNVTITPGYTNYKNNISWMSSSNPELNVSIGKFLYKKASPFITEDLTEENAIANKQINFWPLNSTIDRARTGLLITLTDNTFTFWNGGTVPFFQDITFSIQVGDYLYPQDVFSLFLFRNDIVYTFKTDITLSSPFVWKPYTYETTYLPNDQLKLKSNSHVNYGLSTFTFEIDATVNVDDTTYGIFSTIKSTLTIAVSPIPSFYVYLCHEPDILNPKTLEPLLLTTINESIYTFQPYTINYFNSNYLNEKFYLQYKLVISPTVTIESTRFTLFQDATVSLDDTSYGIFSTANSTLTIAASPQPDFYVYLSSDSVTLNQLKLIKTNESIYTFQPYTINSLESKFLNKELYLLYILVDSPTFTIESKRFTLFQDATVSLDNTSYNIFSTITSTLTITTSPIPYFNVYLCFDSGTSKPNPLDLAPFTTTNESIDMFQPSSISLTSDYLDENLYLRYELSNSRTFTIESTRFTLFQNATVKLDEPNYTIISTIVCTLDIPIISPSSFTVQLTNGITSYEISTNMDTNIFSFKAYIFANTTYVNTNVKLQFILNDSSSSIIIESVEFQISSTYFTLNKPQLVPEFARATSNIICATQKKNNVPTATISIKDRVATPTAITGQAQYVVPCGILSYIDELNGLLPTMSIRSSLLFLIQKYSIPIPSKAVVSQKRYQYPTADVNVQYPILQYTTTFRLGEYTLGYSINKDPSFVEKIYDARILSIANNDAKTISSYYTDMIVNATTWLNTLPPLTKDGSYIYCVIRPISGSAKRFISATITLRDNQLILTPFISKFLLLIYIPYKEGDITIVYSSPRLTDVIEYMRSTYYQDFLDGQTAL